VTVMVTQAYRFALDPTAAQARDLERHAGAARFAYNWALAAVRANLGQRAAERSYGLGDDELTPALGWSLPALRRAWNQAKGQAAPWWGECSKEAYNGMLRNRRLARHIADAGFGEIRRQLSYKTTWNGGQLMVADRWFPSSKTCSACGAVKPKLPLRARTFTCERCGLALDRDLNAAINLRQYVARSGWETRNGRGADPKTGPGPAGGCETPTPHRATGQDRDRSLATASCE
jgi:transposase